jgi:hypothetical protein
VEEKFKSKDGRVAKNNDKNAEILKAHFSSVFNSQVEVDFSVVDEIPRHGTQYNLGKIPSKVKWL